MGPASDISVLLTKPPASVSALGSSVVPGDVSPVLTIIPHTSALNPRAYVPGVLRSDANSSQRERTGKAKTQYWSGRGLRQHPGVAPESPRGGFVANGSSDPEQKTPVL